MIRLLIADDEDLLRSALAALLALEDDLTVVAEASTSTEAVRPAREFRPTGRRKPGLPAFCRL